jgi:hypothetical protein
MSSLLTQTEEESPSPLAPADKEYYKELTVRCV